MNIINLDLNSTVSPPKRDTDFYSLAEAGIVLINDNQNNIDIDLLNQEYREKNFIGIPYHYIVMRNGLIYSCVSRMYKVELGFSYQNVMKNSICILMEGRSSDTLTNQQIDAIVQLVTMIVLQDNMLITNITSTNKIELGIETATFKSIVSKVKDNVTAIDVYRAVGDGDSSAAFKKIVAGGCIDTFDTIALYTKIPKSFIINMNPHISVVNGIIPPGTTVFLPDNRVSGYVEGVQKASLINACYVKIIRLINRFYDEEV